MPRSGSKWAGGGSPYGAAPWLSYFPAVVGGATFWAISMTVSSRSGWEPGVPAAQFLVWPGLVLAAFGALVAVFLLLVGAVRQWPTNGWLWLPVAGFPVECAAAVFFLP